MQANASYTNGTGPNGADGATSAASLLVGGRGRGVGSLDAVLDIGDRARTGLLVALAVALGLHGAAAARAALIPIEMIQWTQGAARRVHEAVWADAEVDITKEPEPPPPPPPPTPEPEAEKPEPPPPPVAVKDVPKEPPPPAPPAAAQAGKVLVADPDPNEPVDFTGFVQGTSTAFAGGTTQANGTSATAVRNSNARAEGVPGGTGTAPAPAAPAVNLTRAASCNDQSLWAMPWPAEADSIDEAYVLMSATVDANGVMSQVEILKDPGDGFGRDAKRWAMTSVRCKPALDPSGKPQSTRTTLRVHFER